jgi:DnaJ-class molecular chaperone
MSQETKTCGRCSGSGIIPCPGCSGSGQLTNISEGFNKATQIVNCSGCRGKGTTTCGSCGGSGKK